MEKKILFFALLSALYLLPSVGADGTPVLVSRDATTETYRNPDGTYTKTLYSGETFIKDQKGNYILINDSLFNIIPTNKTGYVFQLNDTLSKYKAYFKNNSNTASSVRFEKDGYFFEYDVSGGALQWHEQPGFPARTDTLGGGVPSNSQNTIAEAKDNLVLYKNAFSNTNLTYFLTNNMMKENFILASLPSIKNYTYLEYTGNIKFNSSLNICANGVCYVPKGTQDDFNTTGRIDFKDINNNTIFYLPSPIITDAANNSVIGSYSVHGSNAQMNFWLRIPTEFIRNATFPIYVDPTVTLKINESENMDDGTADKAFPDEEYGATEWITVYNDTNSTYINNIMIKFNLRSIPENIVITNSSLCMNLNINWLDSGENMTIGVNRVYNNYSIDGKEWTEGTGIFTGYHYISNEYCWTTRPQTGFFNPVADATIVITNNSVLNNYYCWDTTSMLDYYYKNSYKNASFYFLSPLTNADRGDYDEIGFYSKETATIGYRPFLNITYFPAINITLSSPINKVYSYNNSINLNFSITNATALDNCWYFIINSTNGYEKVNTSIASCINTTFGISKDGVYNLFLYANTTEDLRIDANITFAVSTTSPAISLDAPTNNKIFNYSSNIYLNFTPFDSDGISSCALWGNWSGGWHKNATFISPPNNTMNFSKQNLNDGTYQWTVSCNDTYNNLGWALNNLTFLIDTIYPNISIDNIITTQGSQTIKVNTTAVDSNLLSCKFSILNNSGQIDGAYNNISFSCNSNPITATVSDYGTYNLTIYALDSVGWENSTTQSFTTTAASAPPGGGGGAVPENTIPVIGLNNIQSPSKEYNALQREIIYATLNNYCSNKVRKEPFALIDYSDSCTLVSQDFSALTEKLKEYNVFVSPEDLQKFYLIYKKGTELFQGSESQDTINQYNLFTSILGILTPLSFNPPSIDSPIVINNPPPKKGLAVANMPLNSNYTIQSKVIANKQIATCESIDDPNIKCDIKNSTLTISYFINDTNFLSKIFTATLSITTDAVPDKVEQKKFSTTYRVYNIAYEPIPGVPVYVLAIFLIIVPTGSYILLKKKKVVNPEKIKEVFRV